MFSEPDWKTPIDFDARISAVPETATARGMFFQFLLDALGPKVTQQLGAPRYIAFKSYPMRDYVTLLGRAREAAFPNIPAAEAVRRMGRLVYPNYSRTMTGTAVFAIAGRNYRRVVELCPRAYEIGQTPGRVSIRSISDGHAVVEMREIWNVPEFHQVGVWEGGMDVCGVTGTVHTEVLGHGAVNLEVTWK